MRWVTGGLVVAGVALFALILSEVDLGEVWDHVRQVGWLGLAAIFGLYVTTVLADVSAWLMTFRSLPFRFGRVLRLLPVHWAGDALNTVSPGAPFGGEPVKALLLKRDHGVPLQEAVATQVLVQTILIGTQLMFLCVGFVLMLQLGGLPEVYRIAAGVALGLMFLGVVVIVSIQRYQAVSRVGRFLSRTVIGRRALGAVRQIRNVEGRIIEFYLSRPRRLLGACALELYNWLTGAVEIWLILYLLGYPVSFTDAWVIEAAVLLVRMAVFMVPASIGAQEGAFLLVCGAITGAPAVAVAVALIRRFREIAWTGLGLVVGSCLSFRRGIGAPEAPGRVN